METTNVDVDKRAHAAYLERKKIQSSTWCNHWNRVSIWLSSQHWLTECQWDRHIVSPYRGWLWQRLEHCQIYHRTQICAVIYRKRLPLWTLRLSFLNRCERQGRPACCLCCPLECLSVWMLVHFYWLGVLLSLTKSWCLRSRASSNCRISWRVHNSGAQVTHEAWHFRACILPGTLPVPY